MLPGGEADHGARSQHLPGQPGVSRHSLGTPIQIISIAAEDSQFTLKLLYMIRLLGVCNIYGSREN